MPSSSPSRPSTLLLAAIVALLCGAAPARAAETAATPAAAGAPSHVPGEVVVRTRDPRTGAVEAHRHVIRDGESVRETARELERRPDVVSATPNYIARISQHIPNDPGRAGVPGGWRELQWNFLPEAGVNVPVAWENLLRAGRPGGRGVVIAVLDTGVAYRDRGRFRRSPDLSASRFVRGYDFVDRDPYPLDHNGHGTHVASTIGQSAGNGKWLTGIAYGARIMPVRVLNRLGEGDSVEIAAGIRFAAGRGAKIINLSFEFGTGVSAGEIPDILDALRYARRRGALVVGASGNGGAPAIAYPARADQVLSVGATTEHRCQADYSNTGRGLDLVAPGGGADADLPAERDRCRPGEPQGRDIYQTTFLGGSFRRFGLPAGYVGTSMAAPHVSAVAALVVASRVIGADPTPNALERHLEATAADLGPAGRDDRYGAGLLDAAKATTPAPPAR
jgi:serine protease